MHSVLKTTPLIFAGLAALMNPAAASDANLILYNGNIITMNENQPAATALAISDNHILAVGDDTLADKFSTDKTRRIDLQGKTVIPGLVDTHIHAIRGGQTYTSETYWYNETKLPHALKTLQEAAAKKQPDQWVAVVGSWLPEQFEENRAPTVAELSKAVPDHPVYVQYLYDYALLNEKGIETLKLNEAEPVLPQGIQVERDANGKATGKLLGHIGSYNALFAKMMPADSQQKLQSMQVFFSALNSAGMTGFIDPSAGPSSAYENLFALQMDGKLTLRAGYRIPAMQSGTEAEWFKNLMAFRQPYYDTGMVSFLGIGESIVAAMNDGVQMGPGFTSSQAAKDELRKVAQFAAQRRIPLEIHAYTDDAASDILTVLEDVNTTYPLQDLRWSLAHLNTGSEATLERMKKLGLSYTVQMGPYFEGPAILKANGEDIAAKSPPTRAAIDKNILVAGGTDSTRIGIYGIWQAIEYHVTGRSLGGVIQKAEDQLLSREEALALYTKNAAWIGFAEQNRGTLETGKQADLAVLDQPYLTVPAEEIDKIRSLLTIVDGKIVHENLPETPAAAQ